MYNQPYYDNDTVTLGYLKEVLGDNWTEIANAISKTSKNYGTTPTTPYHKYDTFMTDDGIYICINDREIGEFNINDWTLAGTYKNTKEDFEQGNGIITKGTLQATQGGTNTAGITGKNSGENAIRIWAGSTLSDIDTAPFRVTQAGAVTASNMNIIGGSINLQSSDNTYTTLKVKDSLDSTYYSGLNGKSFTLWHGDKRRVYLTQILDASALVVQGEDNSQAVFSSQGSSNTSDIRLKDNTKNIDLKTSYDIINTLKPIEFTYKNGNITHRGLSAQQVKKVLNKKGIKNQIYSKDLDNKYYMLNYSEFIPDLINCIKYQNKKINTLEKRLEKIDKRLEKIDKRLEKIDNLEKEIKMLKEDK